MRTPAEERRLRCQVAVWAYAYEMRDHSLVPDDQFDRTCYEIDPNIKTGDAKWDAWFEEHFMPHTGQWIRQHPDHKRLDEIFENLK